MDNFDKLAGDMDKRSKFDSDFYKLVEGNNLMRIVSEFTGVKTMNEGKNYKGIFTGTEKEERAWIEAGPKGDKGKFIRRTQFKAWAWAIIRESGELRIVQLGNSIIKQLYDLRTSTDYAFKAFPMPYDINIKTTNAGTLDVNYSVMAARQNTEVTADEIAALNKKKSIEDIIKAILNKQTGGDKTEGSVEYPAEKINPDDIPF